MIPQRTFSANPGETSIDNRGPDAIEKDIDHINKMFNPNSTHADGSQGGISESNLNFNLRGDLAAKTGSANVGSAAIANLGQSADSNVYAQLVLAAAMIVDR